MVREQLSLPAIRDRNIVQIYARLQSASLKDFDRSKNMIGGQYGGLLRKCSINITIIDIFSEEL